MLTRLPIWTACLSTSKQIKNLPNRSTKFKLALNLTLSNSRVKSQLVTLVSMNLFSFQRLITPLPEMASKSLKTLELSTLFRLHQISLKHWKSKIESLLKNSWSKFCLNSIVKSISKFKILISRGSNTLFKTDWIPQFSKKTHSKRRSISCWEVIWKWLSQL